MIYFIKWQRLENFNQQIPKQKLKLITRRIDSLLKSNESLVHEQLEARISILTWISVTVQWARMGSRFYLSVAQFSKLDADTPALRTGQQMALQRGHGLGSLSHVLGHENSRNAEQLTATVASHRVLHKGHQRAVLVAGAQADETGEGGEDLLQLQLGRSRSQVGDEECAAAAAGRPAACKQSSGSNWPRAQNTHLVARPLLEPHAPS